MIGLYAVTSLGGDEGLGASRRLTDPLPEYPYGVPLTNLNTFLRPNRIDNLQFQGYQTVTGIPSYRIKTIGPTPGVLLPVPSEGLTDGHLLRRANGRVHGEVEQEGTVTTCCIEGIEGVLAALV